MKVVFVLFDSLNRHALSCYAGSAERVRTPNFQRLADRGVVFDRHFVGSLPCMPARRDIQTGRLNFLHRGWGPLEPFDRSIAEILQEQGVYTHLITDHYHYFEDGGTGFHGRYSSWEFIRGQEKDKWRPRLRPQVDRFAERFHERQHDFREDPNGKLPYYVNRDYLERTGLFPLTQCFDSADRFLEHHHADDDWFLHLECFDPHEPFFAPDRFLSPGVAALGGKIFDWPSYGKSDLNPDLLALLRGNYEALVAACDEQLGRLLDRFDRHDLWADTWLVLTTDHGLLLGEKEYLGKNRPPFFNEVAHIPLLVAPPRATDLQPRRAASLTQTIDLMPTMLDIFNLPLPPEVQGRSLLPLLSADDPGRAQGGCIFGQFGAAINFTDGRHTYFRYPVPDRAAALNQYTLMPMHMRSYFEAMEFVDAQVTGSLPFTRGYPVWRLPVRLDAKANMTRRYPLLEARTVIHDIESDPAQASPIEDPVLERALERKLVSLLRANDAPLELYDRYGLEGCQPGR
ncbi:MAG: sulfatase [Burkholderiaceae bacterium]|nr:sulfatase [Burkholderiaceae bacterium]